MALKGILQAIRTRQVPRSELTPDARRHHTIISGTGRAGTTFLVKLFTNLGLDTGFSDTEIPTWSNCHAGLEWDLRDENAPYLVKSPWICDYIDEIVSDPGIVIDYAIIPMRSLAAAAESRRHVQAATSRNEYPEATPIPGGLWPTTEPIDQESVLAQKVHRLTTWLAKTEARLILVHYPRLTHDPFYLFNKLRPVTGDAITSEEFSRVHLETVDPSLVHRFSPDDC
jgi:hypothetical protein